VLFDITESTLLVFPASVGGSYIIPNSVTIIGEYAFAACCYLTSVTIPDGVTNIGAFAFEGCFDLPDITIPGSVTSIGEGAFHDCPLLARITIPASATNIGEYAFWDCRSLASVFFQGNAPAADSTVFTSDNVTVYYMPGATGWDDFSANTGVPVVLWNPMIQTSDGSFGVSNNQFGFNITSTTNIQIVVEACTNLAKPFWTPLQAFGIASSSFYFSDPQWTNFPGCFYRISAP
jgi:hypothetical protein